ncbi:MAG: NFACT family protein [Acidobacteriia bacterium]|nr:NFACT family protein [Terriglobia bacterium]
MDNLALQALIQEIHPRLIDRRCVQIFQTSSDTLVLELNREGSIYLVFNFAEPSALFVSDQSWPSEPPAAFAALLRKRLNGARIKEILKPLDERTVFFNLENTGADGGTEKLTLVSEMAPRWGNLYLLDVRSRILGTFSTTYAARRNFLVNDIYCPPSHQGSLSLERIAAEDPSRLTLPTEPQALVKAVRGLSLIVAKEICFLAKRNRVRPAPFLSEMLHRIQKLDLKPSTYESGETLPFIFGLELETLADRKSGSYNSMNEAIKSVFEFHLQTRAIEAERRPLRKAAQSYLKKFQKLDDKLSAESKRFLDDLESQQTADLILAQPDRIPKNAHRVELVNLFQPRHPRITVSLDPHLSAVANAQKLYEKAKRARRAVEKIQLRQHSIHDQIHDLEQALIEIEAAPALEELKAISRRLHMGVEAPTARSSPTPSVLGRAAASPRKKWRKCRVFLSAEGREILVGRNSKENDWVTTRYAQPDDYWFHVADYAGSHVVLKNSRKESLEESEGFLEAARIAAYFSQARNAPKVNVHWTRRKFVKKPRRAKPGLVTLSKFQSVLVEPKLPPARPAS